MKPTRFWIVLAACHLLLATAQAKPVPRKGDLQQPQQQKQQQQRAKPTAVQKPKSEPETRPAADPIRHCLTECWLVARQNRKGIPS